jgi:hypothetical protein
MQISCLSLCIACESARLSRPPSYNESRRVATDQITTLIEQIRNMVRSPLRRCLSTIGLNPLAVTSPGR